MTQKKSALGKGLSALLESSDTDVTSKNDLSHNSQALAGSVSQLSIDRIETNPFQPRTEFDIDALKELADSIKEQGIIQPITVRKLGYDRFQIISGERRFRASKLAGLTSIPAYVRIANDQSMLEMALVENIQRQDLNAVEIGISYKRLIDECNLTQEQLSHRVGKDRSTVTNYLRLLKLPPQIQSALRDGKITMGHARAIIGVEDVVKQIALFNEVAQNSLSVRDTELLAKQYGNKSTQKTTKTTTPKKTLDFEMKKIQNVLSSHFSSKIDISRSNSGKGKIVIPFADDDDLNRILELLNY